MHGNHKQNKGTHLHKAAAGPRGSREYVTKDVGPRIHNIVSTLIFFAIGYLGRWGELALGSCRCEGLRTVTGPSGRTADAYTQHLRWPSLLKTAGSHDTNGRGHPGSLPAQGTVRACRDAPYTQ